jgi:hypothetical protein
MTTNIDFSQTITTKDKKAAQDEIKLTIARAQCHRRITQVCSEIRQINLSTAAAAGVMNLADMERYRALQRWISDMRATWQPLAQAAQDPAEQRHWPIVPEAVLVLLAKT